MSTTKRKSDIVLGDVSATADEMALVGAKVRVTMMVDLDIVKGFKALAHKMGGKYQTLMNLKLRESLAEAEAGQASLLGRVQKLERHVYKGKKTA